MPLNAKNKKRIKDMLKQGKPITEKSLKKLLKSSKTYQGASYKMLQKSLGGKKSIARKLVGKFGAPGKAAVGAAVLIDYAKMKQKGKKGCGPGMSKVTKNGKSYCAPSRGSKKGRDY